MEQNHLEVLRLTSIFAFSNSFLNMMWPIKTFLFLFKCHNFPCIVWSELARITRKIAKIRLPMRAVLRAGYFAVGYLTGKYIT